MVSTLQSVSALLVSFGILCVGHGLNNTLLGVRAGIEGYPAWVLGVMTSGYFAGFVVGARLCARLLPGIGHIRAFSAFASLASAVSLFHLLFLEPLAWIVLRALYGICIAGLYVVIESWLSALSERRHRARVLSVYMVINFLCLAAGQALFFVGSAASFELFVLVSIAISLALVPLTVSRSRQPELAGSEHFGIRRLFQATPLGAGGCLVTGMISGTFWGLTALYLTRAGVAAGDVAIVTGAGFVGGLLLQWPLGMLSDRFDRRYVIAGALFIASLCAAAIAVTMAGDPPGVFVIGGMMLVFGGCSYTLYSLFIALSNDFLESRHLVSASSDLITLHAIGAIFGPLLASGAMAALGPHALFGYLSVVAVILLGLTALNVVRGRRAPARTTTEFVPLPRTAATLLEMDPRGTTTAAAAHRAE